MRPNYPTILFLFTITLFGSAGCASFAKYLSLDDSVASSEYEGDPVALAAVQMRKPASSPALDPADDALWNHRAPPTADTISFGMPMEDVAAIWGRPTHIDSAGNTQDGNQRWTYYSGLSSRYGLGSKRIVYFENGKVAGWNK